MKILICNDDGIESNGLKALAEEFARDNEVLVVAPRDNMSAVSHSLSLGKPIELREAFNFKNCKAYSVTGYPADCVKIARHVFGEFVPDVVLSGINKGHNFGSDILYSGTVSIAFEAAFFGHNAFAFSAYSHGESDFKLFAGYARKIVEGLLPVSDDKTVWNVNFPDAGSEIKGVRAAKLGNCIYKDFYDEIADSIYILRSETQTDGLNAEDTDIALVERGYVAVTPLAYDRTDVPKLCRADEIVKQINAFGGTGEKQNA